jgi:hypothetical protein
VVDNPFMTASSSTVGGQSTEGGLRNLYRAQGSSFNACWTIPGPEGTPLRYAYDASQQSRVTMIVSPRSTINHE